MLAAEATKEVAAALAHLDEHLIITDRRLVNFTWLEHISVP